MRIHRLLPLACLAVACTADSDRTPIDAELLTAPVFAVRTEHFMTHATGSEEVPPNDSQAQGEAQFRMSADGSTLHYRLIVANVENVTQSHIHLAPAGSNGGIVVWLYPSAPPAQLIPGRFQGLLAEGDITADDLVNALAGAELEDLLDEIRAGNAYVNVHTSQFPPGEIRGQLH
ncbi:MAG TPA: CHRD domain-containing protein [Longimicrobiales bacterium]